MEGREIVSAVGNSIFEIGIKTICVAPVACWAFATSAVGAYFAMPENPSNARKAIAYGAGAVALLTIGSVRVAWNSLDSKRRDPKIESHRISNVKSFLLTATIFGAATYCYWRQNNS